MPSAGRRLAIEIQPRDLDILRGLFDSRVMTLRQATALYFDGREQAAMKRTQALKGAGLIAERPRRTYEPSILYLTKRGFDVLHEHCALSDCPPATWARVEKRLRVSDLTLNHELDVVNLKVALTLAIKQNNNLIIDRYDTWPAMYEFIVRPAPTYQDVLVKPDSFLRINEAEADGGASEWSFFVEVDRGSESQWRLAEKMKCYASFYRSGGMAERMGFSREEYKEGRFVVLWVLNTIERRNNMIETFLRSNPPVLSQAWATTREEFLRDPLGPIWVIPREYAAALRDTPFDPHYTRSGATYIRQVERERLVERAVPKHRLLGAS